jgi:hypothetical protein
MSDDTTKTTMIEVSEEELCVLLAARKAAVVDDRLEKAASINVETCEYSHDERKALRWFVISPESSGWIESIYLPEDARRALHARIEREDEEYRAERDRALAAWREEQEPIP